MVHRLYAPYHRLQFILCHTPVHPYQSYSVLEVRLLCHENKYSSSTRTDIPSTPVGVNTYDEKVRVLVQCTVLGVLYKVFIRHTRMLTKVSFVG